MSKHKPETREEFKDFLLRTNGQGVVRVNVTDDQLEDCVETALDFYRDYSADGMIPTYLKHVVTADDKANRWIPVDDGVQEVIEVYSPQNIGFGGFGNDSLGDVRYQFLLGELHSISSHGLSHYVMSLQYLEEIEEWLQTQIEIRFNRHVGKLYIDTNWQHLQVGDAMVFRVYVYTDPHEHGKAWNDRFLKRYGAALVKRQWGTNLSKWESVALPGGQTLSGAQILSDAKEDIQRIEEEANLWYAAVPLDFIR